MERLDYFEGRVKVLEGEKAALEKLVAVAQSAEKDTMEQVAQCTVKLEATASELKVAKEQLEKAKAEIEAEKVRTKAEADTAYGEGLVVATDHYKAQVFKVRDKT